MYILDTHIYFYLLIYLFDTSTDLYLWIFSFDMVLLVKSCSFVFFRLKTKPLTKPFAKRCSCSCVPSKARCTRERSRERNLGCAQASVDYTQYRLRTIIDVILKQSIQKTTHTNTKTNNIHINVYIYICIYLIHIFISICWYIYLIHLLTYIYGYIHLICLLLIGLHLERAVHLYS